MSLLTQSRNAKIRLGRTSSPAREFLHSIARLAYLDLSVLPPPVSRLIYAALLFAVTTPIGIAIGLGIRETYNPGIATASVVSGVSDAFSAGALIYTGLVELLAHDFLFNPTTIQHASNTELAFADGSVMLGFGCIMWVDGPPQSMGVIPSLSPSPHLASPRLTIINGYPTPSNPTRSHLIGYSTPPLPTNRPLPTPVLRSSLHNPTVQTRRLTTTRLLELALESKFPDGEVDMIRRTATGVKWNGCRSYVLYCSR